MPRRRSSTAVELTGGVPAGLKEAKEAGPNEGDFQTPTQTYICGLAVHRAAILLILVACALVVAACGSRIPTEEHLAAHSGEDDTLSEDAIGDQATDGSVLRRSGSEENRAAGSDGEPSEASGDSIAGGGSASQTSTAAPRPTDGGGTGDGDTSPIVIGSVGNYSGPSGNSLMPGVQAVQVWAKWVNSKGGVAGHPIEYIVVDDGSDPARHRAAVQDLVENRGVIAFVGQFATQTGTAAQGFLEKNQIPVIGGSTLAFHNSPMFFPPRATDEDVAFGAMKNANRLTGKTKLAVLSCIEADVCTVYKDTANRYAGAAGLEVVYQADISVAQPDFTAECIRVNSSNAELILVVGDQNTMRRVMEACRRQGSSALLINQSPDDRQAGDPLFEGSLGSRDSFPFVGVPGDNVTKEYVQAFEQLAPDQPRSGNSASGWAAAKVFEKTVIDGIGTGAPSSGKLLEALWTFDGETFGGLTVPLRFGKGKNGTADSCWFSLQLTDGQWVAPDGLEPSCR